MKKHQKELKRKKHRQEVKSTKAPNRYWPIVHCIGENVIIAFSSNAIKVKYGKGYKVKASDWTDQYANYRDPKYKMDFQSMRIGKEVHCPNCGSVVDFRLWLSSTKPRFSEIKWDNDKKDDTIQLPNS